MTHVVFTQRALVAASLQMAATSSERHGTYSNRLTTRPCPNPKCVDGEVFFRHVENDPQTEDSEPCHTCGGTGAVPIPRQIPGTGRAA